MNTQFRALAQNVWLAVAATPAATPSPLASATPAPSPHGIAASLTALANNAIISGLIGSAIVAGAVRGVDYLRSQAAKRERASNPYWIAASTLLRETLFDEFPEAFSNRLIEKIGEHIAAKTEVNKEFFRVTRLVVEDRLLESVRDKDRKPRRASTVATEFAELKPVIDPILARGTADPDTVELENCFQLAELRERVRKYFTTLTMLVNPPPETVKADKLKIPDANRFITRIKVLDGFVAPAFLVAGLLQQFDEDWPDALHYFNDTLGGDPTLLLRVQRFEFFCWLLWGPSIPACTCARWRRKFIAFQYGYGDENNSFPLIIEDKVDEACRQISRQLSPDGTLGEGRAPLAFGSEFSGVVAWGPRYRLEHPHEYPPIYAVPAPPKTESYLLLGSDRVSVMEDVALLGSFEPLNAPCQYYSAYLWIMFQACWDDEQPPAADAADRWKSLFPVFEHANEADGRTLSFLKERLAEKAIATVQQLEREHEHLRLRYLCATDDPGDVVDKNDDAGAHRSLFPLSEGRPKPLRNEVFANGGQPDLGTMTSAEKNGLRAMLYDKLAASPKDRTRMFEPGAPGTIITACHLPRIIQQFYQQLPQQK